MSIRNSTRTWGSLSKALHWIIVLLIINQWVIGMRADSLPVGLAKLQALAWHKSFGITILMLAVVRLVWRWMNPVPDLSAETRPWERVLAKISHVLLYGLIFALPLSGWLMSSAKNFPVSWFSLFQLPDLVAPSEQLFRQMREPASHAVRRAGRGGVAAHRRGPQTSLHRSQRRAEAHAALRRRQVSPHD